jgi:hypothetical protein
MGNFFKKSSFWKIQKNYIENYKNIKILEKLDLENGKYCTKSIF